MENKSGFINLNKPEGMSSAAAVSKVKRIAGMACGHMGTLDPMASGVLPVAIGNATRLFSYLLNKEKRYRAVFRFGVLTDTLDSTGSVLSEGGRIPVEEEIENVLSKFCGEIEQVPPAYSAKNVNGVRAYRLAREGKEVALQAKRVYIREISLVGKCGSDRYEFVISCGGGTYIRSLARDIGAACGTEGIMTSLIREKSGVFRLQESVLPSELTAENWEEKLIAPDLVFEFPKLNFDGYDAVRLRNGLKLDCGEDDGEYKLYLDDEFYGIAEVERGIIRAKVKLI